MWQVLFSILAFSAPPEIGTITLIVPGQSYVVVRDLPVEQDGKQIGALAPGEIISVRTKAPLRISGRLAGRIEMERIRHFGDALDYFEQRMAAEPEELKWRLAHVQVLLACGKHQESVAELKNMRAKHGQSAALWKLAAVYQQSQENFVAARERIDQALKLDPKDADIHFRSGEIRIKQLDFKGAVEQFDEALRLDPQHLPARVDRSLAFNCQQNWAAALSDCQAVLAVDPENEQALYVRGITRRESGDPDLAIRDFTELLRLYPKSHRAYEARGVAWNDKKDRDKALTDLDEAIRLAPKEPSAYTARGKVWNGKEQWQKAVSDFSEAIRLNPKLGVAYCERGWSYGMLNQYDRALADANEAIALSTAVNQPYSRAYRLRANAHWGLKKMPEALADFDKALQLNPNDYEIHTERAYVLIAGKQYERALADWTAYLERMPDSALIHFHRAATLEALEQWDKALADWDEAVRLAPDNAEYHRFRGQLLLLRKNDRKRALADFDRAIELKYPDANLYGLRASLHASLGSYELARKDLDALVERLPNDAIPYIARAGFLTSCPDAKYRDASQALKDAQRALQLVQKKHQWMALQALAAAQAELNNFDAAIATVTQALASAPDEEKRDVQKTLDHYKNHQSVQKAEKVEAEPQTP